MIKLYINIKRKRIECKLTQEQLAHMVGYSDKSMIARIEKGEVDLPISKVPIFAEALGTTPMELIGWNEKESDESDSKRNELSNIADRLTADEQSQLIKIAKTYLPE